MTDVKISGLTAASTISGVDLIPIVQSGTTKKITFTDLSAGLVVPDASTTVKGIAELATNAETATGTDTTRIVTPDDLRYGLANGAATSIKVNGATGTTNTGDVNITGQFKVNGAVLTGIPTATVTALTGSSVTLTVDFTTYSSYKFEFHLVSSTGTGIQAECSSNGGSSYGGTTYETMLFSTGTGSRTTGDMFGAAGTYRGQLSLFQRATTGNAIGCYQFSASTTNSFGGFESGLSAAINRVKFAPISGSFNGSGYVISYPTAAR